MRNNSKRILPPGLKKYLCFMWACNIQYFEQPDVPQELLWKTKSLFTHQGFQIQALKCGYNYKDQEEIVTRTEKPPVSDTCPTEEIALVDLEILTDPITAPVYMPHTPYAEVVMQPTELQEFIKPDVLDEAIHTKLAYETTHDLFFTTLTIFDLEQPATD
ncbi:hypothetical protein DVH24_021161 [Malus domestica]|uniref:Uncharacterized protein n=1 Tax=Malus domestica TaxID=3750 RepID=A0A498J8X5_MALDO|nr:hypothetical protein DVH24_021161 [Malus domestica]